MTDEFVPFGATALAEALVNRTPPREPAAVIITRRGVVETSDGFVSYALVYGLGKCTGEEGLAAQQFVREGNFIDLLTHIEESHEALATHGGYAKLFARPATELEKRKSCGTYPKPSPSAVS